MSDLVERLREIAEQYKCPWGDPGSNPDYFSIEDYEDVRKAAAEIELLHGLVEDSQKQRAEIERLTAEKAELLGALRQALRQWRMYADQEVDRDLATEKSPEGDLYRAAIAKVEGK